MRIEEINALHLVSGGGARDFANVTAEHVRAAQSFRLHVAESWPSLYRELQAARALREWVTSEDDSIDFYAMIDEYDAARAETDK